MDPVTLILTALGTGAAIGGQAITTDAIKDAYSGLKNLIQQKFADKPKAELALKEHETDPITWEAPLKQALAEVKIDQDGDIIEAAQRVLALTQPQQAALGKYNVQVTGDIQGYAQGDFQHITMHFENFSKEK